MADHEMPAKYIVGPTEKQYPWIDCPGCAALRAERDEFERLYLEERAGRTKGGANLRCNHVEWTNTAIATPQPGAPLPDLKPHTVEGPAL